MEVKYHDPDLGQPVPSITIWWDRNDVTRTSLLDLHINHGVYKAEVTPDGRMSLITLDRVTVTHMLGFSWILGNKQEINTFLSFATRAVTSLGNCWANGVEIFLASWCENCHANMKTTEWIQPEPRKQWSGTRLVRTRRSCARFSSRLSLWNQ